MIKQIAFIIVLIITVLVFVYTAIKVYKLFKLTKPAFKIRNFGKRIILTFNVVFLQSKIFRMPVLGFLHALVFWGFCVILDRKSVV